MKKSIAIVALFICTQLSAQRILMTEDQYKEFIPIDPIEYPNKITYFESDGTQKEEYIAKLKAMGKRELLLDYLSEMISITTLTTREAGGEIKYLVNSYSQKNKTYAVNTSWFKCRTVSILDDKGVKIGEALLGVGVRLKADITSKAKNLNLAQIFSAGAALATKKFSGTLAIYSIGLSGKEVTAIAFTSDKFDETTAWEAVKTIETMKLKIYDPAVTIEPKIVAIRKISTPAASGHSIDEIRSNIIPTTTGTQTKYQLK